MNAARRVASLAGMLGWFYSWFLIRGIRAFFSPERGIGIPGWLVSLMALVSTSLLGCAIVSAMRVRLWPVMALASGFGLAGLVFAGQYAIMETLSFGPTVSAGEAVSQALSERSPFLAVAVPTLLVLAGLTGCLGWIRRGFR